MATRPVDLTVDVAVVGAGMAGTACALVLCERGRTVALIGPPPESGIVHLSPLAVDLLGELGLETVSAAESWPIRTSSVRFGAAGSAEIWPERWGQGIRRNLMLDRLQQLLSQQVRRLNGLALQISRDPSATTVTTTAQSNGTIVSVQSSYVVVATGGSPSELGLSLGSQQQGMLCSTRQVSITGTFATAGIRVYVPLSESAAPGASFASGWIHTLPGGREATVGLNLSLDISTSRDDDIESQFQLMRRRARGDGIELQGYRDRRLGGLRHDFSPARSSLGNILVAGEATGLSNPFTGEGISQSLQSGVVAADAIDKHFAHPTRVSEHYRSELAMRFVGELDAASWGRRRSRIGWRVLADTADDRTPFVAKIRRAVLSPAGLSSVVSVPADILPPEPGDAIYLTSCDKLLLSAVRNDWPFLARAVRDSILASRIRPARLVLESSRVAGSTSRGDLIHVAAAVELALLASLAGLSVRRRADEPDAFSWGQATMVISSDFLLAQSFHFACEVDAETAGAFARWLQQLVRVRAGEMHEQASDPHEGFFSQVFRFPAQLAAHLSGADDELVHLLGSFGALLGSVFLCAESLAAARSEPTRLECDQTALHALGLSRLGSWTAHSGRHPEGNGTSAYTVGSGVLAAGSAELATLITQAEATVEEIERSHPGRSSALLDMLHQMARTPNRDGRLAPASSSFGGSRR